MPVTTLFTSSISSANMLGNRPGAYKPLFSPLLPQDTTTFDEGPHVSNSKSKVTTSSSGSMDTTPIDPYTQGVEMTRQAQYDAGIVKIWSGEPGHRLLKNGFGMDKNFFPDPGFADLDLFDPVNFLNAQAETSPLWFNIITFPIITGDNDQLENFNFNGIIEPLPIRPIVAFFSIDVPQEARGIRGAIAAGNTNQINGSDLVQNVYLFEPQKQAIGYLDMVDIIEGHPLNGYFRHEFTTVQPFIDQRLNRNDTAFDPFEDAELVDIMDHMTGSTDNYVRYDQRSAPCGWDYDRNTAIGTDSLAFGGMTY